MKTLLIYLCLAAPAFAGDPYLQKGDYYQPRPIHNDHIVVAVDSRQHEPRWQPMLDDNDLKRLIYIQALRRETVLLYNGF